MVSQKTFQAVAAKMARSKPLPFALNGSTAQYRSGALAQWTNDVVVIADVFAEANPKFNRVRFYAACGIENQFTANVR